MLVFFKHTFQAFMTDLTETETFASHLASLPDARARHRIQAHLNRVRLGLARHGTPVIGNLFALPVDDHQVYYVAPGGNRILLLCIGQSACVDDDVACAVKLAEEALQ